MQLAFRIIVTISLFFAVWRCVYGYQIAETMDSFAIKSFVVAFGIGSAAWIVYSIVTRHSADPR